MPAFRAVLLLGLFVVVFLSSTSSVVLAQRSNRSSSRWQTLSGDAPLVIARGGFSGIFPSSSLLAYNLAMLTSVTNVALWCDVQLTKDAVGICVPEIRLENSTYVDVVYPKGNTTYLVNGESTPGWFALDYTLDGLTNVTLKQGILSRTNRFDGNPSQILLVEDVASQFKPQNLWLNIQYDTFFAQHNLSMRSYVLSISRRVIVNYISSPEVGFLRSIFARFKPSKTKLVFRFLEPDRIEPSTNQTYDSLLKNLTFIKTFASGILVPKYYIWPVNTELYLQPHTSLVSDGHKEALEVFASEFMNDVPIAYNFSYDPLKEVLYFVDNGDFSVDGVLSDFPMTPSEAIGCFSHIGKNSSGKGTPKVISHNGASGFYPGSTDLANNKAVEDGADYIDCFVQMTSDGIPICLGSVNLIDATDVLQSPFNNLSITIPEIPKNNNGIFTFNLTWKDIQSLKPAMFSPDAETFSLYRNPAFKNAGKLVSLDDFLTFAKNKSISGVLIRIENAVYLAERKGLGIVDAVLDSLNKTGYSTLTTQEVIIQSTEEAVLTKFKEEQSRYKRMYMIKKDIRTADNSTIEDIKNFANSVAITKESVFPETHSFLIGTTNAVQKLHSFNLPVYVFLFRNEFVSQPWDFADSTVEINSYATLSGTEVDGIITDFPETAAAYRRNKCLDMANTPNYMLPFAPGGLLQVIAAPLFLPPAEAPNPVLIESDVAEPPLPPVSKLTPNSNGSAASLPTGPRPNSHQRMTACIFLSSLSMLLASLLLL